MQRRDDASSQGDGGRRRADRRGDDGREERGEGPERLGCRRAGRSERGEACAVLFTEVRDGRGDRESDEDDEHDQMQETDQDGVADAATGRA